jgi:hypothetical protein
MSDTPNPAQSAAEIMRAALLTKREDVSMAVKAEDIPLGGGMDYSLIFWEPQVGKNYTIKFLKNLEDVVTDDSNRDIIHRKVYKNLPDPTRKGKTFQSVSSNNSKTDLVLDLFFELHALKKAGDALAIQKIDEYLGVTNQGCSVVQVLASPDAAEIGIIRLFTFSTFGPNATIANLINEKLNPSKEKLAEGFEKEDIFNIFSASGMFIECVEADYEGRKGRDFTKSAWTPKPKGAYIKLEDGREHTFSANDLNADGSLKPDVEPFFMGLITALQAPTLSIHNYFSYKPKGHPKNTEDTEKYLVELEKKVAEIVPIIRNAKNLAEIGSYGAAGSSEGSDSATTISGASAKDILKESAPSELASSILNSGEAPESKPSEEAPSKELATEPVAEKINPAAGEKSQEVDDILNS